MALTDGGRRPGGDAWNPDMQAPGDDGLIRAIPKKREVDLVLRNVHSFLVYPCFDVDYESGHSIQRESQISNDVSWKLVSGSRSAVLGYGMHGYH